MATAAMPKVFKNFINGEWVEARSGKAIENRNPANTGELFKFLQRFGQRIVRERNEEPLDGGHS